MEALRSAVVGGCGANVFARCRTWMPETKHDDASEAEGPSSKAKQEEGEEKKKGRVTPRGREGWGLEWWITHPLVSLGIRQSPKKKIPQGSRCDATELNGGWKNLRGARHTRQGLARAGHHHFKEAHFLQESRSRRFKMAMPPSAALLDERRWRQ